jgi:hypothetical protein
MRSVACLVVSLCLFAFIIGCGSSADMSGSGGAKSAMPAEPMAAASDSNEIALPELTAEGQIGQGGEAKPDIKPEQIQRQIIYTARLNLIVEEFDGIPEMVEKLASGHSGFIADSTLEGSSGSPRSGTWTIRVPVRQYGTFLDAAKTLGEFQSLTTESQEVTAEYYDVKARIANKQLQEKRLLELLEKGTGKLEDILAVEDQLARVREEVERMQGRMRVLKDLTAFSTITLSVNEIKGYQPPEAPTFGNRIARAWSGTLDALMSTGQNLVIGIVAVGPWLVILSIPFILFIWMIRMLVRKRVSR